MTARQLAKRIWAFNLVYATALLCYCVLGMGCPPTSTTPPTPDASDATVPVPVPAPTLSDSAVVYNSDAAIFDAAGATSLCLAACQAFVAAGCPQQPDCPHVLQVAQDDHLIRLPSGASFTCSVAMTAKNKTDVVANGGSCAGGAQ